MLGVRFARLAFVAMLLATYAAPAAAEDISGIIGVTKVIVEDSRLVGDVTCTTTTTPCIQFGAPNIALRLNGFTITGPANPDDTTTCPVSGPADGISNGTNAATSQPGVHIIGPGMVQKFRRHGIFIVGATGVSTNATVKHVTSHHNCLSGLLATGMTDSVVSVRNAANSGGASCGGICLPKQRAVGRLRLDSDRAAQPQPARRPEWSRRGTDLLDHRDLHQRLEAQRQRVGYRHRTP